MAKTAFLILAHHQPAMLKRLVDRLDHPDAVFMVHIDRKSDETPFRKLLGERVAFVPRQDRVKVYWCGFSTTRSILATVRAAVAAYPASERFVLLSGVDYPIRPIDQIMATVSEDVERIAVDRQLNWRGTHWLDTYANRVFLGDNKLLNPRTAKPLASRLARAAERHLPRLRPHRLPVYHGAGWWALTRAAIDIVLRTERDDPQLLTWFRHARVADELVFQTLLMSSPRAAFIQYTPGHDQGRPNHLSGVHYVDWTRPNPDLPRTLDLNDLERMLASGGLFARKIDPVRSVSLMEALDRLAHAAPQDSQDAQAT